MSLAMDMVRALPDVLVLLLGAGVTALSALGIAALTRRFWFEPHAALVEEHGKLLDLVHNSLLAFTVFILALVLTDVRGNFGRAEDATLREASIVSRLDRDLQSFSGADAATARTALNAYVRTVMTDEWRTLGDGRPALSPAAGQTLMTLLGEVRNLTRTNPDAGSTLRQLLERLEEMRQVRFENATKSTPRIFWWTVAVFLVGAMAMNGRYPMNVPGASFVLTHMAAIGLLLALIVVMDEPFRGATSISPEPIARAIGLPGPR